MFARDRQTRPWVEQWKGLDRWWARVQCANGPSTPADEMMDLFYAFFQNLSRRAVRVSLGSSEEASYRSE